MSNSTVASENSSLTRAQKLELLALLQEKAKRQSQRKIQSYYPESGLLRRELYAKHIEFFALGAKFKQRLALCANRIGKTEGMGGYELVCHLTGEYPDWWPGYRYTKPIRAWAAGESTKDVRDSLQVKLCGPMHAPGTGLIPYARMRRRTPRSGVPDAIDTVYVESAHGGLSSCTFKSYDQGRESFQAADIDLLWLDEEAPLPIYAEGVTRTMTTRGLVMLTFTPLLGMSELVLQFLPGGEIAERQEGTRAVLMATWDDAPHLTADMKQEMLESYPPYQRDARSKGIPQLGAGAIYPVPESEFVIEPMEIPKHWKRAYALDVGWKRTAAVWGAMDPESDTLYLYSEHYRGDAEPSVHAEAIEARGEWIRGVVDPSARGRSQVDGSQLITRYRELGLDLTPADNAVESGIYAVWERLSSGRLKVFRTLTNLLQEYRLYRRDEKGRIVKENDHLLDAVRYLIASGLDVMSVEVLAADRYRKERRNRGSWQSA